MSGSPERFVRSGTCRDGGGKGMRAAENGACPKGDATCCGPVASGDGPLRRAKCVDVRWLGFPEEWLVFCEKRGIGSVCRLLS